MGSLRRVLDWLVQQWQWPAASMFTCCLLLLIAPLWFHYAGWALGMVYLQLPVYMLHQWEEHTGDRFRLYVNRHVAGGREALTPMATFWINFLGVWVVDLLALYLAGFVEMSLGLIAIYLPLINAIGHIAPAIATRRYNPGLWTALTLFLPIGCWSWHVVGTSSKAGWEAHAIGVGFALSVHAVIMVHMLRSRARLNANGSCDAKFE